MKTIREDKMTLNNNETVIKAGVYEVADGYMYVTPTKSGTCKKLATAMKKAGFNV